MIYFETERLIFRAWREEDIIEFRLLNEDTEVMRYFPHILSMEEADSFYQKIQEEIKAHGFGLYAVEEKQSKEFIGFIGLHRAAFNAYFTPCIEIGWRLKREAWGKGYAQEGAKACLNYGFNKFGFDKIYSFTAKINSPSENVMKKIGMTKVGEFNHPNVDEVSPLYAHVLYCIDKR